MAHIIFEKIEERDIEGLKQVIRENEFNLDNLLNERNEDDETPLECAAELYKVDKKSVTSLQGLVAKGKFTEQELTQHVSDAQLSERIFHILTNVTSLPKPTVTTCRATNWSREDALKRVKAMRDREIRNIEQRAAEKLDGIVDNMVRATIS